MAAASAARSGRTRLSSSSIFSGSPLPKAGRPIAWCTPQTRARDSSLCGGRPQSAFWRRRRFGGRGGKSSFPERHRDLQCCGQRSAESRAGSDDCRRHRENSAAEQFQWRRRLEHGVLHLDGSGLSSGSRTTRFGSTISSATGTCCSLAGRGATRTPSAMPRTRARLSSRRRVQCEHRARSEEHRRELALRDDARTLSTSSSSGTASSRSTSSARRRSLARFSSRAAMAAERYPTAWARAMRPSSFKIFPTRLATCGPSVHASSWITCVRPAAHTFKTGQYPLRSARGYPRVDWRSKRQHDRKFQSHDQYGWNRRIQHSGRSECTI